jgi:hypothetical protein
MADRSFVAGNFEFQLDGIACGQVKDWKGGNVKAEVVNTPISAFYWDKKNIGNITYNPFEINLIGADSSAATDWIEQTIKFNFLRKSGEIRALDMQQKCRSIRQFRDALVTGVAFPKGDASSKEATYLNLKFQPEIVQNQAGDGKAAAAASNVKQKMLRAENFKMVIDGMEDACKRVNTVESISFTQTAATDQIGDGRNYQIEPGKCAVSNLTFTLSEADAQAFLDWHADFVIAGNCTDDKEKNATMTYMDQSQQKELIVLTLKHVGIFDLNYDPLVNGSDTINRIKIDCYVEELGVAFTGIA